MTEPRLGILTDQKGVYHYVDTNGRLYCTRYRPETLEIVEREDTFGMELCEKCDDRETDRNVVDSILDKTEA